MFPIYGREGNYIFDRLLMQQDPNQNFHIPAKGQTAEQLGAEFEEQEGEGSKMFASLYLTSYAIFIWGDAFLCNYSKT